MINASGCASWKTLNEILDYSEIEANKTEVSFRPGSAQRTSSGGDKTLPPFRSAEGVFISADCMVFVNCKQMQNC